MKTSEFNEYLSKNRIHVLTVADVARIIGKPKAYASLFVFRDKALRLAERGLYYTKDASGYEIASSIVYPSYVSLISSLRFHNLTEQIPNIIYVVTTKRHGPIEDADGYRIEFKNVKREMMFGYRKIDGAFVADPEKAVIDMVYLGLFEEYASEAIENGKVDLGVLSKYLARTKIDSLRRRISLVAKGAVA